MIGLLLLSCGVFSQAKFTISGEIDNASNGEVIPFCNVIVKNLNGVGTTSNIYGFYSLTLEQGQYSIEYSALGFKPSVVEVDLTSNQRINVELEENVELLGTVEITDTKENDNITSNRGSVSTIDMKEAEVVASLGGEPDILRVAQLNPGIKPAGEGSSGFYVRGGALDQNLILLDEAPVYNPSHLLGFFSVFNGDALSGATVYKGGMPAEYGGRTASVMDIRMKEGNMKDYQLSGGMGILSGRLTLEGPIVKDKGSFMVSGRRTWTDLLLSASGDESLESSVLFFYDLNVKANYKINDKNRVFLSGYFGRDNFGFEDQFGLTWGNASGTLRWNHIFSDKLFSNTSLIYSNYDYEFSFNEDEDEFAIESIVRDINLKQDFSYYLNNKNTLKFGFNLIDHRIEPGNLTAGANTGLNSRASTPLRGIESAIYLQNEQTLNSRWSLNYGLRVSSFSQLGGDGNSYQFDDAGNVVGSQFFETGDVIETYYGWEPRLSVNYLMDETQSFKLGFNRNYQYVHQLTNATASTPTDVWIMSTENIAPQTANQLSLGYFKNFKDNVYEASAEVYYKGMDNVIDYRNGAETQLNDFYEGDLLQGTGESYGLELFLKKRKGRFTGWLSYTLSRTLYTIPGINNGEAFSARQDRINDISITTFYELNKKITLSANFVYYTGDAVTFPSGKYEVDGSVVPLYTERNGSRMPDYHRLDLALIWKRKNNEKFESSWTFSIYNAYARENAFVINFEPNEDTNISEATQISLFRFVPSVTYNFKFK